MKTLVLANQKGGVGKTAVATLSRPLPGAAGPTRSGRGLRPSGQLLSVRCGDRGVPIVSEITADRVMTQRITVSGSALPPCPRGPRAPDARAATGSSTRRLRTTSAPSRDPSTTSSTPCIVDTNPNPDIRLISALASADHVLAPIQLTMEAMEGIYGLLNHDRVGVRKVKALLNPKLDLIGILPMMVEATPFQRANLVEVVTSLHAAPDPAERRSGDIA